ncbi:MAG: hypothetical protein K6G65_00080 [Lachnospiraceae bacterium]|nr:hypothetical protein [Lachnospiraceae bacterium]
MSKKILLVLCVISVMLWSTACTNKDSLTQEKYKKISNLTEEDLKEPIYECICYNGKLYHYTGAGVLDKTDTYIGKIQKLVKNGELPEENFTANDAYIGLGDELYILKEDSDAIYCKGWHYVGEKEKATYYVRYAVGVNHEDHRENPLFDSYYQFLNPEMICYKGVKYSWGEWSRSVDTEDFTEENNLVFIGKLGYANGWEKLYESHELYGRTDSDNLGNEIYLNKKKSRMLYMKVKGESGDYYRSFFK